MVSFLTPCSVVRSSAFSPSPGISPKKRDGEGSGGKTEERGESEQRENSVAPFP